MKRLINPLKPITQPRKAQLRKGITLVELLVVVAIISILTAIMIPRLRTVNKDRNIREAARIVGSTFSTASQRAITEGSAGIVMERHPNFVSNSGITGVRYAVTTMYQLRSLPPYTGDDEDSTADNSGGGLTITIDRPLEHDPNATPPRLIVRPNDYISLNNSKVRYRIADVSAPGLTMTLVLDNAGYLPNPPMGADLPFVIYRQPRKLESSRVELPEGYLVDLRYTGATVSGTNSVYGTDCNQAVLPTFSNPFGYADEIRIIFNNQGGVDRVYFYDQISSALPDGEIVGIQPTGSLYMFVAAYEIDETIDPINQPSNLWVTVNNTTGGVNVGYNAPPTGSFDVDGDGDVGTPADVILEARGIAVNKQSAAQ